MYTITRRGLFDAVWSTPVVKLEERFGVSGVAIAKACKRHRVPTPPRGYWAKLAAGKPVKRPVFAHCNDPSLNEVVFVGASVALPAAVKEVAHRVAAERKSRVLQPQRPAPIETVEAIPLEALHAVVRKTAVALRKATPDRTGSVSTRGQGLCGVRLHHDRLERAIAVLNGLAQRLTVKGYELSASGNGLSVGLGADSVSLCLTELTRWVPHISTSEELKAEEDRNKRLRRYWDQPNRWRTEEVPVQCAYPDKDEVFTGQMILNADGPRDGVRRKWSDGKRQRLEAKLDDIAGGVEVLLAARKSEREQREAWERERQEQQRRDAVACQFQYRERKRQEVLRDVLRHHRRLAELRVLGAESDCPEAVPATVARFREWLRDQVERHECALSVERLEAVLARDQLFPDADDLEYRFGDWWERSIAEANPAPQSGASVPHWPRRWPY